MNKKGIKMRKVRNVNKILLLVNLFFLVCFYGFSQGKLEGRFNRAGDFYKFYSNGTFEYRQSGELGIDSYGEGHYSLTKDSLILDFDSTKLQSKGYVILKPYQSFDEENIKLKIRVFDLNKKPLHQETRIFIVNDTIIASAKKIFYTENGEVNLSLKKQRKKEIWFEVGYDNSGLDVKIPLYSNFEVDVYLSGFPDYIGRGLKYVKWKYKFVKMKKDYFEVKTPNGSILKFERTKENYYADDPFSKQDPLSKYLDNRH